MSAATAPRASVHTAPRDVYKRQGEIAPTFETGWLIKGQTAFPGELGIGKRQYHVSVSYTHLDVYKRQDMELKSLKKKYKDKKFAAGCSREVIERGAELCGCLLYTSARHSARG